MQGSDPRFAGLAKLADDTRAELRGMRADLRAASVAKAERIPMPGEMAGAGDGQAMAWTADEVFVYLWGWPDDRTLGPASRICELLAGRVPRDVAEQVVGELWGALEEERDRWLYDSLEADPG